MISLPRQQIVKSKTITTSTPVRLISLSKLTMQETYTILYRDYDPRKKDIVENGRKSITCSLDFLKGLSAVGVMFGAILVVQDTKGNEITSADPDNARKIVTLLDRKESVYHICMSKKNRNQHLKHREYHFHCSSVDFLIGVRYGISYFRDFPKSITDRSRQEIDPNYWIRELYLNRMKIIDVKRYVDGLKI